MEQIYTIPVNEAFEASAADASLGCPFCRLYNQLEDNELDLILGASMMEPDVRVKTNEQGFCATHFAMMLRRPKRLPLALLLESHLAEQKKNLGAGAAFIGAAAGAAAGPIAGDGGAAVGAGSGIPQKDGRAAVFLPAALRSVHGGGAGAARA